MEQIFPIQQLCERASAIATELTPLRRHIHQHPELAYQEKQTTALVRKKLEEMGVELIETDLPVGVIGVIRGTAAGSQPVTAFRADLDALPIQEQTGLEYASQNPGVMHACGHDGHTTVLLGTARLLQEHKNDFSGTVILIFQAAQETLAGAKDVIATGVLDDEKVQTIIALHSWPFLNAGQVGVYPGQAQASSDTFTIRVIGKSGHVSRPWLAQNPIFAACLVVNALNGLASRELVAGHQALVGITGINGGKGFNVIPDAVEITGAIRCLDPDDQDRLQDMLFKTAERTAESMGCTAEIEYTRVCPSMANTPEVAMQFRASAAAVLGGENACLLNEPSLGSEDFAYYVQHVGQGLNARLGMARDGQCPSLHNNLFDFNDDALSTGIAALAGYVMDVHRPSITP